MYFCQGQACHLFHFIIPFEYQRVNRYFFKSREKVKMDYFKRILDKGKCENSFVNYAYFLTGEKVCKEPQGIFRMVP